MFTPVPWSAAGVVLVVTTVALVTLGGTYEWPQVLVAVTGALAMLVGAWLAPVAYTRAPLPREESLRRKAIQFGTAGVVTVAASLLIEVPGVPAIIGIAAAIVVGLFFPLA